MFNNVYQGKTILVTGNTGFKGAWLTQWLLDLGAKVIGYSKDIPTTPSLFETLKLHICIEQYFDDIRDLSALNSVLDKHKPDFIFHLAAQPIVSLSYSDPIETTTTNTIGMMNICEAARKINWPCVCVLITSDKAYDNIEWVWGYKETDALGGKDIYSGSKGAAELIAKSYLMSFAAEYKDNVRFGIARAGNVIGGGDWAKDRLVVDCYKAWSSGASVEIRSPNATRPWQHVLEPLSGYLNFASALWNSKKLNNEAFNFGPSGEQNKGVLEVLSGLAEYWSIRKESHSLYTITDNIPFNEAGLLKLNCDKALFYLKWVSTFDYTRTMQATGEWYDTYYNLNKDMSAFTLDQIHWYGREATKKGLAWTE